MFRRLIVLTALAACGPTAETDPECDSLCEELINGCAYEAFPDFSSCLNGCAYDREQGADVTGQLQCVQDAACDTFSIVECTHAFGPDQAAE
jgi:hypothetical protein